MAEKWRENADIQPTIIIGSKPNVKPRDLSMRVILGICLLFNTFGICLGDTITGTLDWTSGYGGGGTADFTFDTVSNTGALTNFVGNFGVYGGNGSWAFSVAPNYASITSFADLTNFSNIYWTFGGEETSGTLNGTSWSAISGYGTGEFWAENGGISNFRNTTPPWARILTPANGSAFTSTTGTFTWTPGTGVSEYWLTAGSSPNGSDIYSSQVTGTSQAITLPAAGHNLYVTLWSLVSGKWLHSNSNTYTALNDGAQILTPANGSAFTSTTGTFTWSPGTGVSEYWLTVGSSLNGSDIYSSQVTGTSKAVTLPADGRILFVTLWSLINGEWASYSYTFTALDSKAQMTSPTGGGALDSNNVTFNWNPGTGVGKIWMTAGSTPGGADLFSAQVTGASQVVTLPADGRRIYVRLWSLINGAWKFNAYTYTAYTSGMDPKSVLNSPVNGVTFSSSNITFNWSLSPAINGLWLVVGSAPNASDICSQREVISTTLTMPQDGRPVYAELWSLVNGVWGVNDYVFTTVTVAPAPIGLITSPANTSFVKSGTLLGSLALNWNAGTGVSEYWLVVGSSPNAGDIYSAEVTGTSSTLQVPLDGRRIYVELWSLVGGSWKSASYYYDTTQ